MATPSYKKIKGNFDPEMLLKRFPNSVPIILKKAPRSILPDLACKLVLHNFNTVGDLYQILRKQIDLPPETALFFFIGDTIPSISATLGELHQNYKQSDNVLHITYTEENVYGSN